MTAAIASNIRTPVHAKDEVVISVTGIPANDSTDYDVNRYPTERALAYRLLFDAPGSPIQYDMTSQPFSPNAAGAYSHLPLTFPVAGDWGITLVDQDDNVIATQALTVN